jgi:hypothetical protein
MSINEIVFEGPRHHQAKSSNSSKSKPLSVQLPRLTAMLRCSLLASPSSSSTADELFVERLKLLKQAHEESTTEDLAPHLLGPSHASAPRSARDAHSRFVCAVQIAVGSSVTGSELSAYANAVFGALQSHHASPELLRATLGTTLGTTPSPGQYAQLLDAANLLSEERNALSLGPAEPAFGQLPLQEEEEEWSYSPIARSGSRELQPATPEPLSPHSAVLRLCKPIQVHPGARAEAASTNPAAASGRLVPLLENQAGPSSWPAASSQPTTQRGGEAYPDADNDAMGIRHAKASLTWLQNLYCNLKGKKAPSVGGDDAELLLLLKVLCPPPACHGLE